jgi:hypothetical protein
MALDRRHHRRRRPAPASPAPRQPRPAGRHPRQHRPAPARPDSTQNITGLCKNAAVTAQRLGHATSATASHSRWLPAASAASWQRDALAAAILGHCSEIVLRSAASRAAHLGTSPAITTELGLAGDAAQRAWPAWQATARALDITTTGTTDPSPVTAELGDLVLWIGRLAYERPGWTPAHQHASLPRDPADLAPCADDLTAVLGAVHYAADAMSQVMPRDREAVRQAAADRCLYVRTRLLTEKYDVPYHYAPIPPRLSDKALIAYDHAIEATTQLTAALDRLALATDGPTAVLAECRAMQLPAPQPERKDNRRKKHPAGTTSTPVPLPERGNVEQKLRALMISEPGMLERAAALDAAAQDLIEQASAGRKRARIISNASKPKRSQGRPGQPAQLASKDLPPPAGPGRPANRSEITGAAAPASRIASGQPSSGRAI